MASSDSEKYLAEDLLINIFVRLDVKSILRCTCVRKSWHHLIINTSYLVKDHLTFQKTSSHAKKYTLHQTSEGCRLLTDCTPLFDITKHSKLYYNPDSFDKDFKTRTRRKLKIHGMCDGLLCFSFDAQEREVGYSRLECYCIGEDLYLWNPICRKSKRLPGLELSTSDVSFGQYGGVSFGYYGGDYKVIVISSCTGYKYFVSVYSLSSNCWNVIRTNCYYQEMSDFAIKHPTKFVDGSAYMITTTRKTPLSYLPLTVWFDLHDETIQKLQCPEEFVDYPCYTIEAYGESIAVFGCGINGTNGDQYLDIWTFLRDRDSSKSSWEKKLVINLNNDWYSNRPVGFLQNGWYSSMPVGFLDNGKYIISNYLMKTCPPKTTFLMCDLESLKVTIYGSQNNIDCHGSKMNPNCVESLLLLDEDSVDPFVHFEAKSSCGSILFTLKKDIGHPTSALKLELVKFREQIRRKIRSRR